MTTTKITLEEHHEIQNLLSDYAWAYDCRDFVAMSETFLPDGVLLMLGERYEGRDAIVKTIEEHINSAHLDKVMQHHIAHLKVFQQGKQYFAYSYWMVPGQLVDDKSCFIGALGWYEDELVKVDGRWFFKQRRLLQGMPKGLPWLK